jgi:hypothetical protein
MKNLTKDGEIMVAFLDNEYKVIVRIDDKNYKEMFAQKLSSALDYIDNLTKSTKEIINLTKLPTHTYKHLGVVCKEEYGFTHEDVNDLHKDIIGGFTTLMESVGKEISTSESIVIIATISLFLAFRKEVMELTDFPEIIFSVLDNKNKSKQAEESPIFINQFMNKNIGQA